VLSCRLVGALALASNLDLEDFGSTVLHFRDICTSVISQWSGAVTHSVGDEILALFGYHKIHENDAARAVHAGLDLVAKIGDILSPSGEPLQARIAIATSLVVVKDNQTAIEIATATATRLLTQHRQIQLWLARAHKNFSAGSFAMIFNCANFRELPSRRSLTESLESEQLSADNSGRFTHAAQNSLYLIRTRGFSTST